MTRVIGIFPDERQASALIDSMRNEGFDRKDMIVSHMEKSRMGQIKPDEEIADIQTELEGFFEKGPFTDTLESHGYGVVVAMEIPKRKADLVRSIMEQNGALDIQMDL